MWETERMWFKITWSLLLLASLVINYIQRMSDALWAHSEVVEILEKTLLWIMFPMTLVLFVWHNVVLWRSGERLFWRTWQKSGMAIAVGGGLALVLVYVVGWCKGEATEISDSARMWILGVFSVIGLVIAFARYKFKNWREE